MRAYILATVALLLLISFGEAQDGRSVNDFDIFFPEVAQGVAGGVSIDSVLTFSNPHGEPVDVFLQSANISTGGLFAFELQPHQSRNLVFRGGDLQEGRVRVIAEQVISASVRITTRPDQESTDVLTSITLLGQPLTSKVIIPVLRNVPEADNTGIAVAYFQTGRLQFTLYDDAGRTVASREERRGFNPGGELSDQAAFLITDLFSNLGDFQSGSLVIEHVNPPQIAQAFAVTALYLRQGQFAAAEVTSIDDPRAYVAFPEDTSEIDDLADELAATYGFEVAQVSADSIVGVMSGETARAVARDTRVRDVEPLAAPIF